MLLPPKRNQIKTGVMPRKPLDDPQKPQPLGDRIRQRITRRLNDRVRDLEVEVTGDRIVLRGNCATYYSKQLAQHAALGAIEDECLENEIEVTVAN